MISVNANGKGVQPRRSRSLAAVALLGAALVGVGCQDLSVTNPNDPDRLRALGNAGDVETLVASSWLPYWNRTQQQPWPNYALMSQSSEMTTTVANNAAWPWGGGEPRAAFDNNPVSDMQGVARWAWFDIYSGLDSANEGIRAIEGGLRIVTGGSDNTERARTFARFSQGLMLGMIGLMYDQGIIVDESSNLEDPAALAFKPYGEVLEAAIGRMERVIELTNQNSFTLPDTWINGLPLTNQELGRLANSFIAQFMVYGARTPEERAALDWAKVIQHVDQGITQDFTPRAETNQLGQSIYKARIQLTSTFSWRGHMYHLGPADVSGAFQDWLRTPLGDRERFLIVTPDRRITGATPTSAGKYYRYLASNTFTDSRGTYLKSFYSWIRWPGWNNQPLQAMTVDEMQLLKAEGLLRTGQIEAALAIINRTRTMNGELPPVTAQGVPSSADCVPRKLNGACGDLMDALMWERAIEGAGINGHRAWWDRRGFGQLVCGSILHLPVSGRELETLGVPVYTTGGVGGNGAASAPNCVPSEGAI